MQRAGVVVTLSCDYCTGTRWLSDMEGLGPCVCVTPDNLRDAVEMYEETEREVTKLGGEIDDLNEQIKKLDEELDAPDDRDEGISDAATALQKYAVSIGLPADPIARSDWPQDLWEAYECLTQF